MLQSKILYMKNIQVILQKIKISKISHRDKYFKLMFIIRSVRTVWLICNVGNGDFFGKIYFLWLETDNKITSTRQPDIGSLFELNSRTR